MTTPGNRPAGRSGARSALLSTSLPQDLLRALVRSDAAGEKLSPQLLSELKLLARTPNLLVACNYGGTLSSDEGTSKVILPVGSASTALRALAALPNTHAAVISGRSLRDLAAVSRLPAEVHLVGSYGAEFDMDFLYDQPPTTTPTLQEVTDALAEVVRDSLTLVKPFLGSSRQAG
jgi:trehalose-6-phosphatase